MPRVSVGIRIKPEKVGEETLKDFSYRSLKEGAKLDISVSGNRSEFFVDDLYVPTCSQAEVFTRCAQPIIDTVIEGFNATIFAFGQTGGSKLTIKILLCHAF